MAFPKLPMNLRSRPVDTQDQDLHNEARHLPSVRTGGQPAPFLGLKARLSQIWMNKWTILLLLVLVRVIILIAGLIENIGDAKVKALSSCTKVEDIGSAMASMPHYLSVGVNKVATESIASAISGMVQVLMLIMTAVEQIIYFAINFYVGTYVCLIAAFIHGSFDIGIGAAEGATKVMNDAMKKITDGIKSEVDGFQKTVNDVLDKINAGTNIGSIFGGGGGGGINIPKLDIAAKVKDLEDIKVDSEDFVKTLKDMKDKTPDFDDVQKFAKDALKIPFDLARKELNQSSEKWAMPKDLFPLAQKQSLSFCSDNSAIRDFFDGLYSIANTAKIAFLVVIPILALLVCIPMAWLEIRRYREQKELSRQMTNRNFDAMDVIYQASRPSSSRFGIWLGNKFHGTNREYLVRWAWAYATSLPALFVLALAIAGLFSCFCQWIILQMVKKEAPALVNRVGDFAGDVVRTLDSVSTKWAADSNGVILKYTDGINQDVFGVVRTATSAVNNTLNVFTTEMNKRLDSVFSGTVLHDTVKNVVRCLIGLKIEAVEKGITWVHEHAKVSFPLFPNDTFSAGAEKSIDGDKEMKSFLSSPSTVTTDEITDAIYKVIRYLENGIIQDALVSAGLLLLYVIVVLVGVIRALLNITGPTKTRGEGGGYKGQVEPGSPRMTGDSPLSATQRRAYRPNDDWESGAYGEKAGYSEKSQAPDYAAQGQGQQMHPAYSKDVSNGTYGHARSPEVTHYAAEKERNFM
ncbi:hypothetical protein MCOR02_008363 [Pyricularia oryzae]|uniref:Plasma membrane fusion protein PRM1 n=1 Tax=Pyricularia oryzae TaxID=318829 RepID=A0A4P7NH07_PYROR|nr:hypothetical protein MCOR02_008363 [Pyricularia oryzae]KAI6312294.1 hypothetical protein MCOR34_005657 [Pyricularia oryzae]KAI6466789.1 hypothetical protein MCOR17_004690 [Pyricularia oryzae]KAI6492147.1 hypothetical protein MCOR13_008088 [Pyricularia oryzae]KAI6583412.1 hypothetical protein MCOR04_005072 [Pyricularia oryzae]